ncbi:MAG: ribonuclease III [Alphaproteobacteria bacterium]|nr:ribonuclease III [Alphaproteobacteria bacterium]MBU0795969.1 ribonuclease III [Alphaproteobacteria bacterium]MBU0885657.1 ribonuclease III [Alphaproteobacteria bacterium]MBU1812687.1 ribonuclease III [Alphaproteobacteria bacterium]MBU2089207.1 ribonuclease III [Alphaproteobacteria bacterium]
MAENAAAARLETLAERLGHHFKRRSLLVEALTHLSATERRSQAYERLEFLGDRVLGLIVAEALLDRFPAEREGDIAKRHVGLVRREALAEVARTLDLGAYLVLSRGESEAGGRDNDALLADAMEAVIAALYLDGGLEAARRFIMGEWQSLMDAEAKPPQDAKTALQEWAQGRGMPLPLYIELSREGPPHQPVFTVEVRLEGGRQASGTGTSKRAAEQAAANALLTGLAIGKKK